MTVINAQGSRLAVIRPDSTNAVTAFTATLNTEITRIFVCNTSANDRTFRLFHGESGDSFDQNNALFYDKTAEKNDTLEIFADSPNSGIMMQKGEILGVRTNAANDLTFSIYGVTANIAPEVS